MPLTIRMQPYALSNFAGQGPGWPSIASLNEVIDSSHANDTTFFSIAMGDSVNGHSSATTTWSRHRLLEFQIWFGNSVLRAGYPKQLLNHGYYPHVASSTIRQDLRSATVYQTTDALTSTPTPTIRPTRQFFGRTRPIGMLACGRHLTLRINDSLATEFSVELSDPWYASDTNSNPLTMVPHLGVTTPIDSLSQAQSIMRTETFAAHDSVTIGATVMARFSGDSLTGVGYYLKGVLELVDSEPDSVVAVLDSFYVTSAVDTHQIVIVSDHDLLSSTYALRVRLQTNVSMLPTDSGVSRVPMGEIVVMIPDEDDLFARLRRTSRTVTGEAFRIVVAPNPTGSYAEARFSILEPGSVTLRLMDLSGRTQRTLVDGERMEVGRYVAWVDLVDLASGCYLLEVECNGRRQSRQVVVTR